MTALTGSLSITVCDAKDLNSDQYGKVDPYCKLTFPGVLCNHRYKTKAHKRGGSAPIWDESFNWHLKGTRTNSRIKISLYDRSVFKKQPIGRARIFLAELLEHRGKLHYYELIEDHRPDFRVAGYIGLQVDFYDERRKSLTQRPEDENPQTVNPQSHQLPVDNPQTQHSQGSIDQTQPQTSLDQSQPQSSLDHSQPQAQTSLDRRASLDQSQSTSFEQKQPTSFEQKQPPMLSQMQPETQPTIQPQTQSIQPQTQSIQPQTQSIQTQPQMESHYTEQPQSSVDKTSVVHPSTI
jgi:hypothetical protein